jgi:Tol biopolymer transport system component
MDAERWQKVEQFCHAALEREPSERPAFLEEVCSGDEELRRKVEALLAREKQAENFLQSPVLEIAAKAWAQDLPAAGPEPERLVGQTVSHYRVLEKLGGGGMGVVYKAEDTRLGRHVALKFLPEGMAEDKQALERFKREARAASALNHPNICTVHDIDEHRGRPFIVMELLRGQTLAHRISGKPLPTEFVLKVSIQVADALACAHAVGLTHRDLKPANVMVSADEHAKVVDFGLAKLSEIETTDEETGTKSLTQEGLIVGTPAYMSPEQVRGRKVDSRTDIFSFGAMLYEMATGRRAFQSGSTPETLTMVLREEPRAMPASVSPDLAKVILLCLKKDRERRFQHMADVKIALQEVSEQIQHGSASANAVLPEFAKPRRRALLAAVLTAVIASAAIAAWLWLGRSRQPVEMGPLVRLTSDAGLNTTPALSPDGKLLAYASDRAGSDNLDIWVKQVDGGVPLRLTSDPANESEPSFSPDGNQIVFRSDRAGGGIYTIPALGGEPRLIAKGGDNPSFSPDGSRIAFVFAQPGQSGNALAVVASTGGTAQQLTSGAMGATYPAWSPDGKFILFSTGIYRSDDWAVVSSGPGPPSTATVINLDALKSEGLANVNPCQWMVENRILFSAKSGDSSHLFEVKISPPGVKSKEWGLKLPAKRLTFGTGLDEGASLASGALGTHTRRLAFASLVLRENIWSLVLDPNRPKPAVEAQQLTRDNGFQTYPYVSRDGTKVVFLSHTAYNDELWSLDLKTGRRLLLSTMISVKLKPIIRSDSSRVLFESHDSSYSSYALYAVSFSGGDLQKLCGDCGYPWDWSAEHKRILFWDRGKTSVRTAMLNVETGKRSVFLERPDADLYHLQWSPDGRWIAFFTDLGSQKTRLYVAPFTGDQGPSESAWIPTTDGSTSDFQPMWSPDGNWLYSISMRDGFLASGHTTSIPGLRGPSERRWPSFILMGSACLYATISRTQAHFQSPRTRLFSIKARSRATSG